MCLLVELLSACFANLLVVVKRRGRKKVLCYMRARSLFSSGVLFQLKPAGVVNTGLYSATVILGTKATLRTHTHTHTLSLSLSRSLSPSFFPLTRFENKRSCILAEKSKRKTGWCSGDLAFGCASNKRRKQPEQQSMHVLWRVSNPKQAITARTHKKRKRKKRSGFYRAHA